MEILAKLDSIVEYELGEAERRIRERINEVTNYELNEARKNIRKKFIKIVLTLKELAMKRAEELEIAKIHDLDSNVESDKKTLDELSSERREQEESEKHDS